MPVHWNADAQCTPTVRNERDCLKDCSVVLCRSSPGKSAKDGIAAGAGGGRHSCSHNTSAGAFSDARRESDTPSVWPATTGPAAKAPKTASRLGQAAAAATAAASGPYAGVCVAAERLFGSIRTSVALQVRLQHVNKQSMSMPAPISDTSCVCAAAERLFGSIRTSVPLQVRLQHVNILAMPISTSDIKCLPPPPPSASSAPSAPVWRFR